jgi:hypothetical protein
MTLPRLNEMSAYWAKHPPAHIIISAQAGFKPSEGDQKRNNTGAAPEWADLPEYEEGVND